MLHTTLQLAREHSSYKPSYRKVATSLGGIEPYGKDTPIPLSRVLDIVGLDDALWYLCAVLPEEEPLRDKLACLLACDYAEHVAPLWKALPGCDWKPTDTIKIVRLYANGQATTEELTSARAAAWAAVGAAAGAAAWDTEQSWQAERFREMLMQGR